MVTRHADAERVRHQVLLHASCHGSEQLAPEPSSGGNEEPLPSPSGEIDDKDAPISETTAPSTGCDDQLSVSTNMCCLQDLSQGSVGSESSTDVGDCGSKGFWDPSGIPPECAT